MTSRIPTDMVADRTSKAKLSDTLGSMQTSINTNTSSLADIMSQVVNVKKPPAPLVGCKADGLTDDTVAINNIISNSTTPYIYLPAGTYRVQYISFINDIYLIGDGLDKTIIKRVDGYNTSTSSFDTTHPEHGNLLGNMLSRFTSQINVSIKGICFDGNVQNAIFDSATTLINMFNNVQIAYCNNLVIDGCKFINSIGDGLYLGGNRNATIKNCFFDHCGYNTKPSANTTQNCMSFFGSFYNSSNSTSTIVETNTTITNCYFNDALAMGVVCRNIKSLIIEDCEFTNITISNLELYGDSKSSASIFNMFDTRMVIKNNVFQNGNVTHGDENKNYHEEFIFENNVVNCPNTSTTFQILSNSISSLFEVKIIKNIIIVPQVYIDSAINVDFIGNNLLYGWTTAVAGVHISNCNNPRVKDNHIKNMNSANTTAIGIQFYSINNEPLVEGNHITGVVNSTREAIYLNYTDSTTTVVQNLRVLSNKIDSHNRGINISSAINYAVLINSNVFDIPTTGDYCVYLWTKCAKAMVKGNVMNNNTAVNGMTNATVNHLADNI